jgi:predicted phage replisome organizer
MADVKWIKLNVDMFDDEKIKIIQAMPDGDSLLVVWIKLITLAGKTNDGGYIYISDNIPYTEEMLSVIMNKPLATIRLALQTFTHLQMLDTDTKGIYLVNFDKHQSYDKLEKIKEQNRERQARFKEKRRMLLEESNVTDNVSGNDAVTEDNATEKEVEEEGRKKNKKKEADVVVCETEAQSTFELLGGTLGKGVVLLTQQQQDELMDKLGFDAFNHYVGKLADFIIEKDAKVSNHYATILKWAREDAKV